MKKIRVKIEALSPLVLSTRGNTTVMTASHDFLSGTLVRGILAERYIEKKQLGAKAHEDEGFLACFFDKLRFAAAYPVRAADKRRAMPTPLSIQKLKDGDEIRDLLVDDPDAGFKTFRGFAAIEGDGIEKVEAARNISLHMSRSNIKEQQGKEAGESSLERLAGRSRDGAIYNYEAVEAGVRFEGEVFGEEAALEGFLDALGEKAWTAQAGRSRYAQYGACRVELEMAELLPETVEPDEKNRLYIRLETPLLAADDLTSNAEAALHQLVDWLDEDGAGEFFLPEYDPAQAVQKGDVKNAVFADFTQVDNFVGIWGMKRPRAVAVAAGSVFVLGKKSAWTESDKERLQKALYEGVGARTEEGFGQLRLWQPHALSLVKKARQRERRTIQSGTVCEKAKELLLRAAQQKMIVYAAEDAHSKLSGGKGASHFFARLDSLWSLGWSNMRGALGEAIKEQKSNAATPFVQNLREIKVDGKSLEKLLLEANIADMPYNKERRWEKELGEKIAEFLEDIGATDIWKDAKVQDALFYAYWHNLFRFARKAAAGKGGES